MSNQTCAAVVQYDGHHFAGWQRQPERRTVQGVLEAGLERLVNEHVSVTGAGRTDAGVHALGQVVSFEVSDSWAHEDLTRAWNAVTPDDVWVALLEPAPIEFNARKDAVARRYRFVLGCDRGSASPFRRPFEWALPEPLDLPALEAPARLFVGTHDFRALSAVGQEKRHYRCNVTRSEWQERPGQEGFIFTIEADRFLHRMVRFVVGLMVDVARERRSLEDVSTLLSSTDNRAASPPAPAEGLYMLGARYERPELKGINEFVDQLD